MMKMVKMIFSKKCHSNKNSKNWNKDLWVLADQAKIRDLSILQLWKSIIIKVHYVIKVKKRKKNNRKIQMKCHQVWTHLLFSSLRKICSMAILIRKGNTTKMMRMTSLWNLHQREFVIITMIINQREALYKCVLWDSYSIPFWSLPWFQSEIIFQK